MTVVAMTTASMLVMWLGDQITARGIGNGISLLIMINICSRGPMAVFAAPVSVAMSTRISARIREKAMDTILMTEWMKISTRDDPMAVFG